MTQKSFLVFQILVVITLSASAALLLVPQKSEAAITQTGSTLNFSPESGFNADTVSTTITVPSDAEFVVVGVSGYRDGVTHYFTGGSMTFTKGGVDTAMTAASNLGDTDNFFMAAMFYMALPDTGSNKSLKWDWSGIDGAANNPIFSVTFWKGVDTASPVRSTSGAQAGDTPYTTGTLTALSGDLIVAWVGAFTGSEGTINSWSNLSLLAQVPVGGQFSDGAWATGSPSGNTTVAASTDTNIDDGGIVAIVVKPAAAASPVRIIRLRGKIQIWGGTHFR